MMTLRVFVKEYAEDLLQLVDKHPDDEAFVDAVKEKWSDKNDLRRGFVIACQRGIIRVKDMGGNEDGGRENVPIGRVPPEPIGDMGGEEDERRVNVPTHKKPTL